ncbi:DsbA family protein [Pseudomonas sp. RIT-PI-o]|uniref:DsbA family protein n=1 Tax=Pseudomonas sp. RIT-PI-o TaxID=1690246 RepID=UPI0007DACA05|nr:thioredoxin domain-containing protein [Pseudomonas sp. RIT-PI-o]
MTFKALFGTACVSVVISLSAAAGAFYYWKSTQPFIADNQAQFNVMVAKSIKLNRAEQYAAEVNKKLAKYEDLAVNDAPDGRRIYGKLEARFTLVEFSDFECPYCKRYHETPKKLVDQAPDHVKWEWRHMPLDFHNPAATREAVMTECAAEQRGAAGFWVAAEEMFNKTRGNGQGIADVDEFAAGIGLDTDKFQDCLKSGRYDQRIQADMKLAEKYKVTGTPATLIVDSLTGEEKLVSGALPIQKLIATISGMIEAHEQRNAKPAVGAADSSTEAGSASDVAPDSAVGAKLPSGQDQ